MQRPVFKFLECGHAVPITQSDCDLCAFCVDYDEAHELHELDALLDPRDDRVVPHTRP